MFVDLIEWVERFERIFQYCQVKFCHNLKDFFPSISCYKINHTVKWVWSYCPRLTPVKKMREAMQSSYFCFTFPHFLWIPLLSLSLLSLSIWHYPSTLVLIELSSCISLTGAALSVTGILIWRSIWVPLISEPPVELSCSLVYLNEILLLLENMRRIIMFQGPQGPCCLWLALNISRRIN